jgi:hypothetical protein
MKVAGFSFIRNAIQFDFPIVEAITSILPICDEFVIAVGKSEDDTLNLIKSIASDKIKIIETVWDENMREGGRVLAIETDKALSAISQDVDWAFYVQGDEVIHEQYLPTIKAAMEKYVSDNQIDGLLFNYLHFYGHYKYVGDSLRWYQREIRVVRPHRGVYSFRDAQGFRKGDNQKLNVKAIEAYVYHYGWVKNPVKQKAKRQHFERWWHPDDWIKNFFDDKNSFDYTDIDALRIFEGTHPQVMLPRIAQADWDFDYSPENNKISFKEKIKRGIRKLTGWRFGEYKNFKIK